MFRILYNVFILWILSLPMLGQTGDWRDYLRQMEEDGAGTEQIEALYENLEEIEAHPFGLNSVTIDDLRRLPFLSEDQCLSMIEFLEKNRPVYSVYELRNIPLLDALTIQIMLPFFVVGEYNDKRLKPSLLSVWKNGRSEMQLRYDRVLPQRAGYKQVADSVLAKYPNRIYRGEDFYHSLKYSYTSGKALQVGFVAEKDAGEPFLKQGHKGYDHYGGYLAYRDIGKIKSLVLGDFKLNFAQGLLLNNNFSLGKTFAIASIANRTTTPTRYASTGEAGYFRGIASAFLLGDFTLTAFYSYNKIDGNLSGDSVMTSLKTDGYHRTQSEISKKRNVWEQVSGANIQFRKGRLELGASLLYHRYDVPIVPHFQEYNRFYFRGKSNFGGSVDYNYRFRQFSIAGEMAMSGNGALATLNTLNFYPKQGIVLSLLQRSFDRSYQGQYANAFSDSYNIQNESGWYFGSQFSPVSRLRISMYVDVVSFPWLRYGVSSSSHSFDYLVQGNYKHSEHLFFDFRYRFRQREKDEKYPDKESTSVLPYDSHKLSVHASRIFSREWSTKTVFQWNLSKTEHFDAQTGWMLSQMVSWKNPRKWRSDFFFAYFHADSYDVRVYSREGNIVSSFYVPSFYGRGMRMALSAGYDISKDISLALKGGLTSYVDQSTVGSGLEEINSNYRLDLMSYLRWRF